MTQSQPLVITRVFNAPVERMWKAWTTLEEMKKWWGPKGFTAPVITADIRVGGKYLYCMQSPDGKQFWSTGTYKEIVPLKKLVCTDSFADENGNVVSAAHYGMTGEFPLELTFTILFEEQNGKTTITLTHDGIPGGQVLNDTRTSWNESLDKLETNL